MTEPTEKAGRRVTLFVRETLPRPARQRAERIERELTALTEAGAVDAVGVERWEKRIPRRGCEHVRSRDLYNEFTAWAREEGVSLRPFFDTRECYSMETGEKGEWIVFPAMCLAVSDGGELAGVYPHTDGETRRSIDDGLRTLVDEADEKASSRESPPVGTAD